MNNVMLAISGKKNSGKTTLIEKLIPLLQDRGISLCVIKHDGHSFDADVKGKDTYRFFQAGARGTAIFDNEKFMVVKHEAVDEAFLSSFFTDVDLVLMEGFKWTDWPKFEIVREGNSDHHFCDEKHLLGIISDFGYNIEGIPTYNLNNYEEIANVIENYVNEEKRQEEDEHNLEAVPLEK
ncbi:MAG: molybdopterin-guanine dinucleotide biosynthesis protein B, partial [Bacillota bacterium]|nr:molybdopterin-guanine dinucleotide biosynthesis protein B [Bacillota bacterium]